MTITNTENLSEARFGADNPNHGRGPVPNVGSNMAGDLLLIKSYRTAVATVRDAGVTLPAEVDRAFDVLDAVSQHHGAAEVPSIQGLSPEDTIKALDDYVTAKSRQAAHAQAKAVVQSLAVTQLRDALASSLDDVLTQLADRYDDAVKVYLDGHDISSMTVAAVAEGDFNGERVARWHAAKAAAEDLDQIANTVMTLAVEKPRYSTHYDQRIALMADLADANVLWLSSADDSVRSGEPKANLPFGLAPALVEAGAKLSLPASVDAWAQRTEWFQDARDDAATEAYR